MEYEVHIFPYVHAYIPSEKISVATLDEGYEMLDELREDFVCADLVQTSDNTKPYFINRNYPNPYDRREKDAAYAFHYKNPNWRDLIK